MLKSKGFEFWMSQLKNAEGANMNQLSYKTFDILNYV